MLNKAFLSLLILIFPIASLSQEWMTIRPGLGMLNGKLVDQRLEIEFVLIRYDSKRLNSLHVIDTYNSIAGKAYSEYSIDEIRRITGATVVVNAGSTKSYNTPNPAGLLKIDGTVVSRIDRGVEHGGLLCISRAGDLSIYEVLQTSDPMQISGSNCVDAVQRGPLLTSRAPYVSETWNQRFRRTVAALDGDGNLYIMVTKDAATLTSVSDYFFGSQSNLRVKTLLNLDGDESSGLVVKGTGGTPSTVVGNVHGLVASALAIY